MPVIFLLKKAIITIITGLSSRFLGSRSHRICRFIAPLLSAASAFCCIVQKYSYLGVCHLCGFSFPSLSKVPINAAQQHLELRSGFQGLVGNSSQDCQLFTFVSTTCFYNYIADPKGTHCPKNYSSQHCSNRNKIPSKDQFSF